MTGVRSDDNKPLNSSAQGIDQFNRAPTLRDVLGLKAAGRVLHRIIESFSRFGIPSCDAVIYGWKLKALLAIPLTDFFPRIGIAL